MAPFHAVIVPINYNDEEQKKLADLAYSKLIGKSEVILDDRNAKPGFKFKDWEFIGIPYMIVCGKRSNEGIVEFKNRETLEKIELPIEEAIERILAEVNKL